MTKTLAEVEKQYGFTPDTLVELEERDGSVVVKIAIRPVTEELKKEGSEKSLGDTFREIVALGEGEDLGTDDWAEEYKQSQIIQE